MQAIEDKSEALGKPPAVPNPYQGLIDRAAAVIGADFKGVNAHAARNAGIAPSTFAAFMNGKYEGDNPKIANQITNWLDSRAEQAEVARVSPATIGYLETPTAKGVTQICTQAQALTDFAVIAGVAGVGKTTALRKYRDQSPHVYLVTAEPLMKSPAALLEALGRAIGIDERSALKISSAIVNQLKDRQGLLIVDEAHHLTTEAFDQLRSIHDNAEVGVVSCGNIEITSRLEGAGRNAQFAPLWSRVGIRRRWKGPKPGDIEMLLDAWDIKDPKSRTYLLAVATKGGALRIVTKTLRLASMLAAGNERAITVGDLKSAFTQLANGGAHDND